MPYGSQFWSSVDLTGNQTRLRRSLSRLRFWSSVDLTGNQTEARNLGLCVRFWSSVDLTGNQTAMYSGRMDLCFGAVSI